MQIRELEWKESQANAEVSYNHAIAETPFGRFLITWKGWKDYPSYSIDEAPWGDIFESFNSLEDAKSFAAGEYEKRVMACAA